MLIRIIRIAMLLKKAPEGLIGSWYHPQRHDVNLPKVYKVWYDPIMEVNETKKYITIKQAARLIGVTELTLRNWDKAGKFVAARHPMNNYRVYTINQVENLLARMDEAPRRAENRKRGPRRLEIKVLDDELPSDNLSQPSKNWQAGLVNFLMCSLPISRILYPDKKSGR